MYIKTLACNYGKCIRVHIRRESDVQIAEPDELGRVLPHGGKCCPIRLRRRKDVQCLQGQCMIQQLAQQSSKLGQHGAGMQGEYSGTGCKRILCAKRSVVSGNVVGMTRYTLCVECYDLVRNHDLQRLPCGTRGDR